MNVDIKRVREYLSSFDFQKLFIEELNWNSCTLRPIECPVGDECCKLSAIAELGGFVVYLVEPPKGGEIPPINERRKIEQQAKKATHEHLLIFVDGKKTKSIWHWVRRSLEIQTATREHSYSKGQRGDSLLQKLNGIAFTIDEFDKEGNIAIIKVLERVTTSFDVEKITKRFYVEFEAEHDYFCEFLKGLDNELEMRWYASVMLNRLMFIYFIQKKGFLDGDQDYLKHKLEISQKRGLNQFYSSFLTRLFFEGFAKEEKTRSAEIKALLGNVPYLNGGLFLPHQLEVTYGKTISIKDVVFERLFAFFDNYSWHMDYRPLKNDNEINPDVLGYIFERYINQKQMGAYYTKEDITDYICKNTIIPFLFDKLENMRYDALHPFPLEDIEPYIYDAVKQEEYLPTETEPEYQARHKRCQLIKDTFASEKIIGINDFITHNLDIRRFTEDWLSSIDDPVTLRAFYFHCLSKVTILDPTVGSGAFLFAALNLMEPLYEICLAKMEELGGEKYPDFNQELARVNQHPNREYFILKSIIVNNLFGVDIMEEAVEICKLRLFLKLVAQIETVDRIEPLPDIDFNIRMGNSLVGYCAPEQISIIAAKNSGAKAKMDLFGDIGKLEQQAANIDRAFQNFRSLQVNSGINSKDIAKAKENLKGDLKEMDDELNNYLASEYGVETKKNSEMTKWLSTHEPFHWFVEFYSIMKNGGFDVIIGNPPYVSALEVKKQYNVKNLLTSKCPDIYAWILERNQTLLVNGGRTGMIVPLSLGFSNNFSTIRDVLFTNYGINWFSSFGRIPSALFSFDVRVRNTIHIGFKDKTVVKKNYTTRLHRWFESARPILFATMEYAEFTPELWNRRIPKVNTNALAIALENCLRKTKTTFEAATYPHPTPHILYYKKTAYNWLNYCRKLPPCYENGISVEHTKFGQIYFPDDKTSKIAMLFGNGKLALIFWFAIGDDFDVTRWNIGEFPIDFRQLTIASQNELLQIVPSLETAMDNALQFKLNAGRQVGNYNLAKCRDITDISDNIFAERLGLSTVWNDIQLYYDQVIKTDFTIEEEIE